MNAGVGFLLFLGLTLGLLAGVVWTGFAARRRMHVPLVVLAVASLGATIFFAEQLGRLYDLEAAGAITPIHLFLAKLTTLAYLVPIATGIATLRRPRLRRTHRYVALTVLALTVATAATGTCMIALAEPLERRGVTAPPIGPPAGPPSGPPSSAPVE